MALTIASATDDTPDPWQQFYAATNPGPALIRWLADVMAGRTAWPAR